MRVDRSIDLRNNLMLQVELSLVPPIEHGSAGRSGLARPLARAPRSAPRSAKGIFDPATRAEADMIRGSAAAEGPSR
jgi:hypothetical protein